MSVEFNEERSGGNFRNSKPKGITGLIIKTGFAKDVRQANLVMFWIIGVMAVIFFISISAGSTNTNDDYDPILDEPDNFEEF